MKNKLIVLKISYSDGPIPTMHSHDGSIDIGQFEIRTVSYTAVTASSAYTNIMRIDESVTLHNKQYKVKQSTCFYITIACTLQTATVTRMERKIYLFRNSNL